jgi:hypothetical protein
MQELGQTAAEQRGGNGEGKVARRKQQSGAEQRADLPTSAEEDGAGGAGDFEKRRREFLEVWTQFDPLRFEATQRSAGWRGFREVHQGG